MPHHITKILTWYWWIHWVQFCHHHFHHHLWVSSEHHHQSTFSGKSGKSFRSFAVMKPSWKFQNMRWKVRLTKYFVLIQHLECFLCHQLVFRSHSMGYIWNWTIQLLKAGKATVICFKKYKYTWLIREGWQQIFSFTNPYAHIK